MTHLLMDEAQENRVAGAVGFNVRTGNYHVFKSKTVIVAARWCFQHLRHVQSVKRRSRLVRALVFRLQLTVC